MNHPPEQRGHWLLGSLAELRHAPLRFFRELATQGRVVRFRLLSSDCYLITDPAGIGRILTSSTYSRATQDFHLFRHLLGEGLLTSEGAAHRTRRRMLQPAFVHERMLSLCPVITEATEAMLAQWRPGHTVEMMEEMLHLTLRIVGEAFFGQDLVSEGIQVAICSLETYLREQAATPLALLSFLPTRRHRRLWQAMSLLDRELARLVRQQEQGRFLSHLLTLSLTQEQIRDEMRTMLLASHETTASALVWAWYLLSQHPQVEARLRDELRQVLCGRSPTPEDLPQLSYPLMVFKETLRLYPPAWMVSRRAEEEDVVAGIRIPRRAIVFLCPWVTHYDPAYWDKPTQFRPERFAAPLAPLQRAAYFPFGGGAHRCIGEGFALLSGQLILSTVAQHYQVRVEKQPVKPGVFPALRPRGGLPVTLVRLPEEGTPTSAASR